MDIRLLEAIKNYLQGKDQQVFLDNAFMALKKNGIGGGFRKNTWWNSAQCRQKLVNLLKVNPKIAGYLLTSTHAFDGGFFDRKTVEEFREKWGAPTTDDKGQELDSILPWVAGKLSDPEFQKEFREKCPEFGAKFFTCDTLVSDPDIDYETFCRKHAEFSDRFGLVLNPDDRFLQFFPRPATAPATSEADATSSDADKNTEASQIDQSAQDASSRASAKDAADHPVEEQKEAGNDPQAMVDAFITDEISSLVVLFRDTKDVRVGRVLRDKLTEIGFYGAAYDYALQITYLAETQDAVEGDHCAYLLAGARLGQPQRELREDIEALKLMFPNSDRTKHIDVEMRLAYTDRIPVSKRLPIWSASRFDYGDGYDEQDKTLRRESMIWMAQNKLFALEFLHGALKLVPDSMALLRNQAQMQSVLNLTIPASFSYKDIAEKDANVKSATDALHHSIECLLADDQPDAALRRLELFKLNEQNRISRSEIENLRAQVWKYKDQDPKDRAKPVVSAPEEVTIKAPVESDAPTQAVAPEAAPQDDPKDESAITMKRNRSFYFASTFRFPMRLMGYVQWRNSFVNFYPHHIEDNGVWKELTSDDAKALFPKIGYLNLQFPLNDGQSKLKDAHPFIVEIEFKSDIRKNADHTYETCWTARVNQNLKGLNEVGYVVVHPKNFAFDLTKNTPVELGDSSLNANGELLANEKVLLAVAGGLAGPFTMRAMANGQTYIPAMQPESLARCDFWKPRQSAVLLSASAVNKDQTTVCFDIAPVTDAGLFEEATIDLTSDIDLLEAAVRDIDSSASVGDIKDLVKDSRVELLTDAKRQDRVLTLAKSFGELESFADKTRRLMTSATVQVLKKELDAKEKPVTEALISALTDTKSLASLSDRLTNEESMLRREHKARVAQMTSELSVKEKSFAEQSRELDNQLEHTKSELKKAQLGLEEKKLQWQQDFQAYVDDAKAKIRNERLAAYMDEDLLPTPAAGKPAVSPNGEAPVDFEARARSTAATLHSRAATGTKLVDALVRAFQDRRAYERDDVVNLFVSLANNFLTVFSGDPGIGKTSACRIVADVLGLTGHDKDYIDQPCWGNNRACDRYLQVPVERGWTSKRDFLGYFNPLTGQFNASDIRYYQAFKLLDAEKKLAISNPYPFVFLLDEANLSSMEYYWANFMDICGGKSTDRKELVLGDNEVLDIPAHLRFLATVNIDDTTETLSPRLLDRAWIIRLPQNAVDSTAKDPEKLTVSWNDLFATFGCRETKLPNVPELDAVFEAFNTAGISVSMRSKTAIARFVAAGTPLLSSRRQTAVDFAVAQKLLPMIRAGGNDAGERLKRLYDALTGYARTQEILASIIERGERNLNFYQFF